MKKKICIALSSILCFIFAVSCGPTGSTQSENQNSLQSNYQYDDYYAGMDLTERVGWLVNDGKSDYTIVIPENATEAENYAAMELQYYVEQSTGVLLPIVTDKGLSFSYSDSRFSIGRTRLLEGASLNTDYSQLNGDGSRWRARACRNRPSSCARGAPCQRRR